MENVASVALNQAKGERLAEYRSGHIFRSIQDRFRRSRFCFDSVTVHAQICNTGSDTGPYVCKPVRTIPVIMLFVREPERCPGVCDRLRHFAEEIEPLIAIAYLSMAGEWYFIIA